MGKLWKTEKVKEYFGLSNLEYNHLAREIKKLADNSSLREGPALIRQLQELEQSSDVSPMLHRVHGDWLAIEQGLLAMFRKARHACRNTAHRKRNKVTASSKNSKVPKDSSMPTASQRSTLRERWDAAKEQVASAFEEMRRASEVSHHVEHLFRDRSLCFPDPVVLHDGCTLETAISMVEEKLDYNRAQQSILPPVVVSSPATQAELLTPQSPLKQKCIFWVTYYDDSDEIAEKAISALKSALENESEAWQTQHPKGSSTVSVPMCILKERFRSWFDSSAPKSTPVLCQKLREVAALHATVDDLRIYDTAKIRTMQICDVSSALKATQMLENPLSHADKRASRSKPKSMTARKRTELLDQFVDHLSAFPWNFLALHGMEKYFERLGPPVPLFDAPSIKHIEPMLDVLDKRSFVLIGEKSSCSGLHLDLLNGTWIRMLYGAKAWLVCDFGAKENTAFFDSAKAGKPMSVGQMFCIPLVQGSDGFMLAGQLCAHAVVGTQNTICYGSHYMDAHVLPATIPNLVQIFKHPILANEQIPNSATEVAAKVRSIVEANPSFFNGCDAAKLSDDLKTLHGVVCDKITCNCRPSEGCDEDCKCAEASAVKIVGCTQACPCGGSCCVRSEEAL